MEEKVLLPFARERQGAALEVASQLRRDHSQIAKLLVRPPTPERIALLREILGRHNALEEGSAGLYARCDERFVRMLDQGAVEEVAALLERHVPPLSPVMRAIGVPEIAAFLRGECSRDDAIARGRQATRNYAKRQYTWFRRQPPVAWQRIETESYDAGNIFETLFPYLGLT